MTTPAFHLYPQDQALSVFPPLLHPHLPLSNPLYNRLQAPHNLPSRHCIFAASFPPNSSQSNSSEPWTILFADRSRHKESQIWIFNSLITSPTPLTPQETTLRNAQIRAAVYFLKETEITEAPGWPFEPLLKFGCVHSLITTALFEEFGEAIPYITRWNLWHLSTRQTGTEKTEKVLPLGFTMSRVPESQVDLVISTSSIPRQASTLLSQANVSILNPEGKLAAWVYLGIDGSIATLYVLPEYRGMGFSTIVANELLKRLGEGEFEDLGIKERAWVHADVKVGNVESEAVMRSLGGVVAGETSYLWVDSGKI